MTRTEIKEAVQRNLGRAGVTANEDTDVVRWINQTIREDICADHNWSGMEQLRTRTSTAGTGTYAFANATVFKDCDWISIRRTSSDNYVRLQEVSELTAYEEFSEQTAGRGFPICFARTGDSYMLRPIPDASTYAIREKVWEYPAEMTSGSDTNFITLYWTKLLEYGVTARGLRYYNDTDAASMWEQLYRDELGKAVSVDRRRLQPSRQTLKPSVWAGKAAAGLSRFPRRLRTGFWDWYP